MCPQRAFWTESHEVRIAFAFQLDPTAPGGPPTLGMVVSDQGGNVVLSKTVKLPPTLAEDAFLGVVTTAFTTWMLTSAHEAHTAMRSEAGTWWAVAEELALTR
jgi:hypothetical protein